MYTKALFVVLGLITLSHANTLEGTIDLKRLEGILQEGIKSKDISVLYFSIKGLKQLDVKIPNLCEVIKTVKYDVKNIEQVFHLTTAASLTGCQNSLNPEVLRAATQVLEKKDVTIPELYHAAFSMKALGKGTIYDKEDALKNLIQLLKKDDSPANYAYLFGLCLHMGCTQWTASHAEGVLQAADESDSKALHFEGGLPITSALLSTILRSYKSLGKQSPLTPAQRTKFGNYLAARGSVTTPRGAALLLDGAVALADDEPTAISITLKGKKFITYEADSIEVLVTDLIGRAVRGLKPEEVIAQSGTRLSDDVVVLSKQPLTQKPNDPATYVLNLSKIKAQYGLYKIALSAGSRTTSVKIAVLGEIQVTSVEVGIGDVDGTTSPKITTVAYPNKLTVKLQADHMQKVSLKFMVKDKLNKPISVQQAFVRIGSAKNEDETIFVAEPDNTKAYKVDLNVGAISKHLKHASGAYSVSIFLGDSAMFNPIAWDIGELVFNFGGDGNAVGEPVKRSAGAVRGPLPEIRHMFREPEPRPARGVSDAAAALCAAPFALLLLLWGKIGINLSDFPVSPFALLFHLGLGGSLWLYGMLWLHLSMFSLLRWLLPLAALTFLSGHRLLRARAQQKTKAKAS